jgi:hypothetical protein
MKFDSPTADEMPLTTEQRRKRRYYERNRSHVLANHKARQRVMLEYLQGIKSSPCADCGGVFDPECMDFDHRPGTQKFKSVSHLKQYTLERVRAEVGKCDVVCANCHRLRTKARRNAV